MPEEHSTPLPAPLPLAPLTMGKFKASRMIVSQSWALLKQDKEIMWFPVLSAITSIIALTCFAAGIFFLCLGGTLEHINQTKGGAYPFLFVYYLVMFFIVNFFQAGIYIIVHGRFNGQDLSFKDGIDGAMENVGKIFVWSAISATVGVLLQILADRSRWLGRIVAWLLGAAWNIMTYFSLPALIIGKTSIKDSFKTSASVIRKTWGETIIINLGVGLFFMVLIFLLLALCVGVVVLIPSWVVALGMLTLFVIAVILLSVISSALASIFKLALYEYATTGNIPQGFSPELIQNAVRGKLQNS